MDIQWISRNENGDFYVCYKTPVQRGIRGKTKAIVDEVLIIGINKYDFKAFCKKHQIDYEKCMEVLNNGNN